MLKAEAPLKAAERIRGFDPDDFKAHDEVYFKHEGRWQWGVLDGPPEILRNRRIKLTIGGADVEVNIAPKKIDYKINQSFKFKNGTYTITARRAGPNGEVWYDLQTSSGERMDNVDQEIFLDISEIKSTESKLRKETKEIVEKIKQLRGAQRAELMAKVTALDKKVREMKTNEKLGAIELWNDMEKDELDAIIKEIHKLEKEIDDEVIKLEKEVADILGEEQKKGSPENKAKHDLAEGLSTRLSRMAEVEDRAAETDFNTNKLEPWKISVKDLDEKIRIAKEQLDNIPGDQKDPRKRKQGEIKALEKAKTDLGAEPKFKKPSETTEKKEEMITTLIKKLNKVPSPKPTELDLLLAEIEKRRKEQAKIELQPRGDYDPAKPEFKKVSSDKFEGIINEWKSLPTEIFNFETEKQGLLVKSDELEKKASDLKNETLFHRIQRDRDAISKLKKSDDSHDVIIDWWKKFGLYEAHIYELERKASAAPAREKKERFVDVPKDLVSELLLADQGRVREIMEQAFDAVIGENKVTTTLESALAEFIDNINPDDALRARLAQHGIRDWESFREQFGDKLKKNFAKLMIEMADSELRMWMSRSVSEIRAEENRAWSSGRVRQDMRDSWNTSVLSKMKVAVGLKFLINMLALGAVGVGTALATKALVIPGAAKAGIVGGAVGLAKSVLQRVLGKDSGYFQQEMDRAKKEAEEAKRRIISEHLIGRVFNGNNICANRVDELGHMFATVMRRSTENGDEKQQYVVHGEGDAKIFLEGDEVCMYHEALKRAAEDEGINESEKVRFEFAKALLALRNNTAVNYSNVPPVLVRGLKWITDAYSGRNALKPGQKPAEIVAGVGGGPQEKRESFVTQALVTTGLGSSVSIAMFSESGVARFGIGAAYGALRGETKQHEKEMNKADVEAQKHLEDVLGNIDRELNRIRSLGTAATEDDMLGMKEYYDLVTSLQSGGMEKGYFKLLRADEIKYFEKHAQDVANFLQRNGKFKTLAESARREISRSGILERIGFMHALKTLEVTGNKKAKEAKNSVWVKLWRAAKRHTRGAVYGVIGGGISWSIGRGIDAVKHAVRGGDVIESDHFEKPRAHFDKYPEATIPKEVGGIIPGVGARGQVEELAIEINRKEGVGSVNAALHKFVDEHRSDFGSDSDVKKWILAQQDKIKSASLVYNGDKMHYSKDANGNWVADLERVKSGKVAKYGITLEDAKAAKAARMRAEEMLTPQSSKGDTMPEVKGNAHENAYTQVDIDPKTGKILDTIVGNKMTGKMSLGTEDLMASGKQIEKGVSVASVVDSVRKSGGGGTVYRAGFLDPFAIKKPSAEIPAEPAPAPKAEKPIEEVQSNTKPKKSADVAEEPSGKKSKNKAAAAEEQTVGKKAKVAKAEIPEEKPTIKKEPSSRPAQETVYPDSELPEPPGAGKIDREYIDNGQKVRIKGDYRVYVDSDGSLKKLVQHLGMEGFRSDNYLSDSWRTEIDPLRHPMIESGIRRIYLTGRVLEDLDPKSREYRALNEIYKLAISGFVRDNGDIAKNLPLYKQ